MGVLAKEAPKWNGAPVFEGDFLKMRASMTRCGGVTIVSKTGKNVQLQSRLFKPSWVFGSTAKPKDILTKKKGWVELPPGGLRSKYGWPGKGGYFTVACQIQNERGVWESTPCSKVVDLSDVKHNKVCIMPSASFKPLNMKKP